MERMIDIFMLVIVVLTILIYFFLEYPAKWTERKYIYGVRNREEFKLENAAPKVDAIVSACKRQALIFLICTFVILGILIFIPDPILRLTGYEFFFLVDLIIMTIPCIKGNRELKSLRSELGIASKKGITYTDIKSAGAVHAFKLSKIIVPDIIAAVFFVASLLNDLKIVRIKGIFYEDMYYSIFAGVVLFIGLIMIPIGKMMDNIKNEVISEDSDININFNRAKKKTNADLIIMMTWLNTVFLIGSMIFIYMAGNEFSFLIVYMVYICLMMLVLFYSVRKSIAIDRRYRKDTTIEIDDDDNWILGLFYYNPDDKRLNVEKRIGYGGTVNCAHPVGKAVYIIGILIILFMFGELTYLIICSRTPLSVRLDNGVVICHHMKDDYTISVKDIDTDSIILGEKPQSLELHRNYGYDMIYIEKGLYSVEGESGCIVFLDLRSEHYITFHADEKTYYISSGTDEEIKEIFDQLTK